MTVTVKSLLQENKSSKKKLDTVFDVLHDWLKLPNKNRKSCYEALMRLGKVMDNE